MCGRGRGGRGGGGRVIGERADCPLRPGTSLCKEGGLRFTGGYDITQATSES